MVQEERFSKTKKVVIGVMDILLLHFSMLLSFYLKFGNAVPDRNYETYTNSFVFIVLTFIFLNILFGVYILYNKSMTDFLYITIIIQVILTLAIMAVTFAGRWFAFPRSVLIINLVVSTLVLFIWRVVVYKIYEKFSGSKKVMVVGFEEDVKSAVFNFENSKSKRHKVTLAVLSNYSENVAAHLEEVDIVYLASKIKDQEKTKVYELLMQSDKKLFLNTSFENLIMVNPNIMNIEDESIIEVSQFKIPSEDDAIKRIVDILFSLVLIIITSPIMLITALLVKATSKGPALYKQVRITQEGSEFNILKFRTMSATAEKESGPVLATSNDARVTSIGKYLRALRIDELPQLINVLLGEMSMVGPRPERPFFVDQFKEQNPYYYLRHNVRAGITGYAQVYGKYATDFNSKLNFDLLYIKKYSLLLDIKIMLQTIKILFDKVSSKGLDEEAELGGNHSISSNIKILN
ncbi:sugar transferase [Carnobacterium antarcticum]|uniref:Sugar transferase n=1 Tax=Carnobacterium antarcticum TaxID=2126436 RepID=A0ABW4NMH0_9LACT|nr:sugar transferase [Carnobacterium sp. CP1]ALV21576.1 Undecaprenyl-phosphate galactosephosphotransferase [Carnobacterium sp. CP1]